MNTRCFNIYAFLLVLALFAACRQEDAQVTPVGKPVDYTGPAKTVKQLLDSANFTVYNAAWKRANMDSVLQSKVQQAYTLLVPSDDAFKAAGITADKVNAMPVADLDTLLFYHTMDSWLPAERIGTLMGSAAMRTLLKRGDFSDYSDWTPYTYYQYLGLHDNKLMVNGKPHPFKPLEAVNGTIYILDEVLRKPEQDMIDYLSGNPDFTFLMEACRLNDSIYQEMWGQQGFTSLLTTRARYSLFTFFAPTNNAFRQAGFRTFDDLRQRALKYPVGYPEYNQDNYYVYPYTSLDSILRVNRLDFDGVLAPEYPMALFSNDLADNPQLSNFQIRPGYQYQNPPQYIRLSFSTANGRIMAKGLGVSSPPLPLATTDLLFRNGVIHVINDGLFMP